MTDQPLDQRTIRAVVGASDLLDALLHRLERRSAAAGMPAPSVPSIRVLGACVRAIIRLYAEDGLELQFIARSAHDRRWLHVEVDDDRGLTLAEGSDPDAVALLVIEYLASGERSARWTQA